MGAPRFRADWAAIRKEIEAGVPSTRVAEVHGVSADAIRMRGHREGWSSPKRVEKAARNLSKLVDSRVNSLVSQRTDCDEHTEPIGYQQLVANLVSEKVIRALPRLAAPRNWKEVATADTLARRAMGLDRDRSGGAAALVRITTGGGAPVDVAVAALNPGSGEPEPDWDQE